MITTVDLNSARPNLTLSGKTITFTRRVETDKSLRDSNFLWSFSVSIASIFRSLMHIDCGYELPEERMAQLNEFLDTKGAQKLDLGILISALSYNKELDLMNETEYEANEYLDAFVALGGSPDKEGTVKKEMLI